MLSPNVRFFSPDASVLERLDVNSTDLQFIVNQYFNADGHDHLITWRLPPGWRPTEKYVTFLFVPGMGHTNNSKLFKEDYSFVLAYLLALANSENKNIIMATTNCGGRVSIGLHEGWHKALNASLKWGEQNLGLDLNAVVLNGGSRGGYGAFCYGARIRMVFQILYILWIKACVT